MTIADILHRGRAFGVSAVVMRSRCLLAFPLLASSVGAAAQTSPVAGLPVADVYYQCVASQAERLRASLYPDRAAMPDTERLIAAARDRCGPQYDKAVEALTGEAVKDVTENNTGRPPLFSPADMASDMRDAAAQGLIAGAHEYAVQRLDTASVKK